MTRREIIFYLTISAIIPSCVDLPPTSVYNVCEIFKEKKSWHKAAIKTQRRWGIPLGVTMSIIYQESAFQAQAKPERKKFL